MSALHLLVHFQLTPYEMPTLWMYFPKAGISIIQQCIPYAIRLGPAWFRESCLKLIPSSNLQKVKRIVDIMHNTSVEIFTAKKMALSEGDEAVMKQVGEGKDIMSVLCTCSLLSLARFAADERRLNASESQHCS